MTAGTKRIRRSKEQSQRHILDAAEVLLVEGGPTAVNVRAVAAAAGITDAGINHHFGNRDQLLEALLRHGGRRLKKDLLTAISQWQPDNAPAPDSAPDDVSIGRLVDAIYDLYANTRYADLALALHQSGWRDTDEGILAPVVDALHHMRCRHFRATNVPEPSRLNTQFAVGVLHQALALDPIFGTEFQRSAGTPRAAQLADDAKKAWWRAAFKALMLDPACAVMLPD